MKPFGGTNEMMPTAWNLARSIGVVTAIFVGTFAIYALLDVPTLVDACDRPREATGEDACIAVEDASTDSPGPFVRVVPPYVERFAWWAASAAVVTLVLVLFVPSLLWWRRLRRELKPVKGALWDVLVPIGLAIFVTTLVVPDLVGARSRAFGILVAIPTLVSWFAAVPANATLFDVHATASLGHPKFDAVGAKAVSAVVMLRTDLNRAVGILGTQIAVWVVWYGSTIRLTDAFQTRNVSRLGGVLEPTLDNSLAVIVYGALLTGLLALAFVIASSRLDDRAIAVAETAVQVESVGDDAEPKSSRVAEYLREMGVDRSQRERFESLVAVSAPLLGAVIAQFLS